MESDFASDWSACEQRLRSTLLGLLRDEQLADEILQETALRCLRGYATFQHRSSFLTWALKIARHEVARKYARRPPAETLESEPVDPRVPAPCSGESVVPEELGDTIRQAVREGFVSADQAEVLRLRFELPNADWRTIGWKLNFTANTCAALHVRGIKALRVFLFARRPAQLGGKSAIKRAYLLAVERPINPLTVEEARAFRSTVLDRETDPLARGTVALLREACTKVIQELQPS